MISRRFLVLAILLVAFKVAVGQDKPRVFMAGKGTVNGMTNGGAGGAHSGGGWWAGGRTDSIVDSHDESMELAKDFEKNCTGAQVTVKEEMADYVTALNRESKAKKGLFSKNDQIQISNKAGDVLFTSAVRSVSSAAKDACDVIMKDFAVHGHAVSAMQSAAQSAPALVDVSGEPNETVQNAVAAQNTVAAQSNGPAELDISSSPDGADIEVDGRFVGNTPSTISVPAGDHTVGIRLSGYQPWERTISVSGGKIKLAPTLTSVDGSQQVIPPTSLGDAARAARARQAQKQEGSQDAGSPPQ